MRILLFGSDPGTFQGSAHPSYRRFKSYAERLEWLGIFNYSPPGHKPITDSEVPLQVFPSNSTNKATFFIDALVLGRKIIKKYKVQALASQDPFIFGLVAYLLSAQHNIPFIVHFHADLLGSRYWLKEKLSHRLLGILACFIARKANLIRAVSSKIRQDLIDMGYPASKIFYVSPPVNPSFFENSDSTEEQALVKRYNLVKNRVFVFIGRLSYQKNLDMLLKAANILKEIYPDFKIMILGDGPERDRLIRLRDRLELKKNVLFLGKISNKELRNYLKVSLALVLTSFYEGTAKVIKEAAFAGRPTISTDTSGVSDAIRDGDTGLVVPIGDEYRLAKAMEHFLKNPEKALLVGMRAREFVLEKFVYQKDVDHIVDVWKRTALI